MSSNKCGYREKRKESRRGGGIHWGPSTCQELCEVSFSSLSHPRRKEMTSIKWDSGWLNNLAKVVNGGILIQTKLAYLSNLTSGSYCVSLDSFVTWKNMDVTRECSTIHNAFDECFSFLWSFWGPQSKNKCLFDINIEQCIPNKPSIKAKETNDRSTVGEQWPSTNFI